MRFIVCLLCSTIYSQFSLAQKNLNVLFVGNSLTYWYYAPDSSFKYYNFMLPELQKMIAEAKKNISIDKITHGGASLVWHAAFFVPDDENERLRRIVPGETTATVRKILDGQWDIVILQERPDLNPGVISYGTRPALKFLDSVIKQVHAKTVLYQAYAQSNPEDTVVMTNEQMFPKRYCIHADTMGSFLNLKVFDPSVRTNLASKDTSFREPHYKNAEEQFHAIEKEYRELGAMVNADVVEIGAAFEKCKKMYPAIPLYLGRYNGHPSRQGAYLIACMFFRYLSGQRAGTLQYHADISEGEAANLRKVADAVHVTTCSKTLKTANSK